MIKQSMHFSFVPLFMLFLCMFFVSGCIPATKIPLDTLRYNTKNHPARTLLVFLPGNGDSISAFQDNGLIEAVQERGLSIDMVATHAHVGYYINWSILTRLEQDVIAPAKAKGYSRIWLVGDSLGAYGALSYAKAHPRDIFGVVLLGAYLGEKELLDEIKQAGGLDAWVPGDTSGQTREQWERGLWAWLKDCRTKKLGCPIIYLGYGTGDRFAYAQDYLATLLPNEQVVAIDGGHTWRTWRQIWGMLLEKSVFP